MEVGVSVALAVDADLNVLVSYADGSVSEEVFDHVDVHAVFVEMGRAGVTEAVRGEASPDRFIALGDSEFVGVLFDHSRNLAFSDAEDFVIEGTVFGELFEELRGLGIDQDVAIFVAFAVADKDLEFVEVEVGDQDCGDF